MKISKIALIVVGILILGTSLGVFTFLKYPKNDAPEKLIDQDTPKRGKDTATYSLVEFGNYECAPCAAFVPVLNELASTFDTVLTIAYRHADYTADAEAERNEAERNEAAIAAEAARLQGKFWEYSNALYENQINLGPDIYLRLAEQLDLNTATFEHDRSDSAVRQKVAEDTKYAKQIGATNLPVFFLNGERLPQMTPQKLKEMITGLIPTPSPSPPFTPRRPVSPTP